MNHADLMRRIRAWWRNMIWAVVVSVLALVSGAIITHVLVVSESITAGELSSLLDARRTEINRLEASGALDRLTASMLRNAIPRMGRKGRA